MSPTTPIACRDCRLDRLPAPGAHSLRAALFPAQASHLYFVSRNDGTHQFSSTLAEHNQTVEKYQKQPFRKRARGSLVTHGA